MDPSINSAITVSSGKCVSLKAHALRCREQTYGHQGGKVAGGKGGGMNWDTGIDMYTLICIKWITKKNLLYKKINKIKKLKKKKAKPMPSTNPNPSCGAIPQLGGKQAAARQSHGFLCRFKAAVGPGWAISSCHVCKHGLWSDK